MIRQAISCDICGSEKKQTNHWFVAYDQGGELRVSGWNSRNRLRPGSKHLCGQTCLHKLVDDFMARALTARVPQSAVNEVDCEEPNANTDTSLTSNAAYADAPIADDESSARLISTPARVAPARPAPMTSSVIAPAAMGATARPPVRSPMELVAVQSKPRDEEAELPVDDAPHFASRNWRAAAWERERERERALRTVDRRPSSAIRRRLGS